MGWTAAGLGMMALMNYMSSKEQAAAARQAAQPLPTYYSHVSSPEQAALWSGLTGGMGAMGGGDTSLLQNLMTGTMPQAGLPGAELQAVPGARPEAGWYSGLDPSVRAGIEEPYMRGMEMLEERLAGRGALGSPRAGISGTATDVLGQYMQQAGPAMAQTGWGMMLPGMLQEQQQAWGAQTLPYQTEAQVNLANLQAGLMPYQMLPMLLQMAQPTTLVGTTPTIQEVQPGAPIPPNYQDLMNQMIQQQMPATGFGIPYYDPTSGMYQSELYGGP